MKQESNKEEIQVEKNLKKINIDFENLHIGKITKKLEGILPYKYSNILVYAFIGKSGSGKSFRAQKIAFENNIETIIDDGLLIKHNRVLAGTSAKRAKTKVNTIKKALFMFKEEQTEIRDAFKREKVKSVLILGTSDGMVEKIQTNLGLPTISKKIYIEDIATKEEIEKAIYIRRTEGKHIVPVPTFEIKKDFSGIIMYPFRRFSNKKHKRNRFEIDDLPDKTIIRPTFSYLGKFTIKDKFFRDIIKIESKKIKGISAVHNIIIEKDEAREEMMVSLELVIFYGFNIFEVVKSFNEAIRKIIERTTAVNNIYIDIKVSDINISGK